MGKYSCPCSSRSTRASEYACPCHPSLPGLMRKIANRRWQIENKPMPQKLAATLALLAFAACLFAGGVHAGNPFGTTVQRALLAVAGTYVVGLVIGSMAPKTIVENVT